MPSATTPGHVHHVNVMDIVARVVAKEASRVGRPPGHPYCQWLLTVDGLSGGVQYLPLFRGLARSTCTVLDILAGDQGLL